MRVFCLIGPTGVGKTEIAIELAQLYNLDIISADSRQIYKFMDIGTAKPQLTDSSKQLVKSSVSFHLIDIIFPDVIYSAADFARDCKKVIDNLRQKQRKFILVGGSGLYLKALFEPFFSAPARDLQLRRSLSSEPLEKLYIRLKQIDPISAQRISSQDRQRIVRALEIYEQTRKPMSKYLQQTSVPEFLPYYVGLTMPRKMLYDKIKNRFNEMIEKGLVDEVKNLLKMGYSEKDNALTGIGYKEIIRFLNQEISLMTAIQIAKTRSCQYAKRQLTWFKKVPGINWIEYTSHAETLSKVSQQYEKCDKNSGEQPLERIAFST